MLVAAALARFQHILPVLAMLAASLVLAALCIVQRASQQLFSVRSGAALCAHMADFLRAAGCVHELSLCLVRPVGMSIVLCVYVYPFVAQQKS